VQEPPTPTPPTADHSTTWSLVRPRTTTEPLRRRGATGVGEQVKGPRSIEPDVRPADYRAWRGLTREGLSDLTGIGVNPLAEIERYARHPSSDLVKRIAEALSIDPAMYAAAWDRGRHAAEAGEL